MNEDGDDCILNESAKKEMADSELLINSITRNGNFPFVLRRYDRLRLKDWYGSAIETDIASTRIIRNNKYWRISYSVKNPIKIK